jgi:Cation transporter/ATPase, N-terminus
MASFSAADSVSSKELGDIAKALGADLDEGLTTQEAAARLAKNGPNELQSAPPTPAWRRVLAQFQDPLIYLLLAAIAVALVAWGVEGWVGWPIDAIVIAIVVILNRCYECLPPHGDTVEEGNIAKQLEHTWPLKHARRLTRTGQPNHPNSQQPSPGRRAGQPSPRHSAAQASWWTPWLTRQPSRKPPNQ